MSNSRSGREIHYLFWAAGRAKLLRLALEPFLPSQRSGMIGTVIAVLGLMPTIKLLFNRLLCRIFRHKFVEHDQTALICARCGRMRWK